MAHFAKVEDGVVTDVIVIVNNDAPDEAAGKAFIASLGIGGEWFQTSYNGNFRGCYAGIGYLWNGTDFVAPPVLIEPE
jgi:hypothetical protein